MHFLFSYTTTAIEGIALYIEGKPYTYAVLLIYIDSDTCMYRSEQRAVASTCLEIAEEAKGSTIIRKVSAYLFCLFYVLCLKLLFGIYLLHSYVRMHLVCMYVCTLLACDV